MKLVRNLKFKEDTSGRYDAQCRNPEYQTKINPATSYEAYINGKIE